MNAPLHGLAERVFAQFLVLEQQARTADNLDRLAYSLVNQVG